MRPDVLRAMIDEDLAGGRKPFCVVPTVGTTSTTSVDSVAEVGVIARQHGLWLHVDAAYAGPAAILDEHRHILNGTVEADSMVVNPHKWLFTPVDLSVLYTRRPDVMRRAVSLDQTPAYVQTAQHERALNYSEYTVVLGRRFRALKLWFVLRYFGREGVERVLRGHIELARRLAEAIGRDPRFEISAPALFSLVCFRYRGSDEENRTILEGINASGFAFLSSTQLHGKLVLRLAIGNIAATWEDVEATWERVRAMAP